MSFSDYKKKSTHSRSKEMKSQSVMLGFRQRQILRISTTEPLTLTQMLTRLIKTESSASNKMRITKTQFGAIKMKKLKKGKLY